MNTLETWIKHSLGSIAVAAEGFQSIQIDQLGIEWNYQHWGRALILVTQAAGYLPPRWLGRLDLTLPMHPSAELVTATPTISADSFDPQEPPSFYVFHPRYFATHLSDGQEYWHDLKLPDKEVSSKMRIRFVSFQSGQAPGGGFDNQVRVHYLPQG